MDVRLPRTLPWVNDSKAPRYGNRLAKRTELKANCAETSETTRAVTDGGNLISLRNPPYSGQLTFPSLGEAVLGTISIIELHAGDHNS